LDGLKPLSPVIPVFILIAIGFLFARYRKISLEPATEIVVYLGAPCLVLTSLASRPLFAAACLTVALLGIEGINRRVILFYGSLPSAVINFVLTEKYSRDPELAASIILLSTLLSLVSVPLVFWLIL